MKILLDECIPLDFRHSFPSHQIHTAEWAGFKGKKNGDLMRIAENVGYDVLITVDQGLQKQQNFGRRKLSIVILRSRSRLNRVHPATNKLHSLTHSNIK